MLLTGGSGVFHANSAVHGLQTATGGVSLVSAVRQAGSEALCHACCDTCQVLKMIDAFAPDGAI